MNEAFCPAGETRRVVLVGGSVRAAAQDAKRGGFSVTAVDRFGDCDLRQACQEWIVYDSRGAWLHTATTNFPSWIVPAGGFQWPKALTDATDDSVSASLERVAYPRLRELQRLNSPTWLAQMATDVGIRFPETRGWEQGKWVTLAGIRGSDRWLWKPKEHAGGLDISFAGDDQAPREGFYLQNWIRGKPLGANFIAFRTASGVKAKLLDVFGGLTYRRHPVHRFVYGGSYGPLVLPMHTVESLRALGQAIAEELPMVGLFNIDAIEEHDGGLALLEVNPRYSASMELLATNAGEPETFVSHAKELSPAGTWHDSLIGWHIAAHEGRSDLESIVNDWLERRLGCKASRYACKRIVYIDHVHSEQAYASLMRLRESLPKTTGDEQPANLVSRMHLCDLPHQAADITSGGPLCSVVVSGTETLLSSLRESHEWAMRVRKTVNNRRSF
jgi:uncharacterized protein